jgi:hypothetical protein
LSKTFRGPTKFWYLPYIVVRVVPTLLSSLYCTWQSQCALAAFPCCYSSSLLHAFNMVRTRQRDGSHTRFPHKSEDVECSLLKPLSTYPEISVVHITTSFQVNLSNNPRASIKYWFAMCHPDSLHCGPPPFQNNRQRHHHHCVVRCILDAVTRCRFESSPKVIVVHLTQHLTGHTHS